MAKLGEFLVRAGFGVLISSLVLAGWLITRIEETPLHYLGSPLASIEKQDRDLANVRRYFLQAIVHYREFLINNNDNSVEIYSQDLRKDKATIANSLAGVADPPGAPDLKWQFEKDLDNYWAILEKTQLFTPDQKEDDGYDHMHEEVIPARNAAQQSLRELSDAVSAEHSKLLASYRQRRERMTARLHITMASSLAIAFLLSVASLRYRSNLRRQSVLEFDEVARSRDDLEHLSGKLLKVQEEERRRLSRELHDGIGQTLTALRMEIHQAHLNAAPGTAAVERLARARMLAEEAVHTVKDISLLLRPPVLDDLGLEPAIAWQADQFTRRTGIPCRFRSSGLQEMLPDDVKTCVFRVVQEALNNCQKHASPTRVQIFIDQTPDALTVQVEDDGAGFMLNAKNAPVRSSGLGILGMRERAAMLGGTFFIQSSLGMGTRLKLSLPLAKMTVSPLRRVEPPSSVSAIGPAT